MVRVFGNFVVIQNFLHYLSAKQDHSYCSILCHTATMNKLTIEIQYIFY